MEAVPGVHGTPDLGESRTGMARRDRVMRSMPHRMMGRPMGGHAGVAAAIDRAVASGPERAVRHRRAARAKVGSRRAVRLHANGRVRRAGVPAAGMPICG